MELSIIESLLFLVVVELLRIPRDAGRRAGDPSRRRGPTFVVLIDKGGRDFRFAFRSTANDTVGTRGRAGDKPLRKIDHHQIYAQ